MKNTFLSLLFLLLACNSKDKREAFLADSLRMENQKADSLPVMALPSEPALGDETTNGSTPVLDAAGKDSLFNILVRKKVVRGEFEGVKLITNRVLDAAKPDDTRNLLAVLVLTSLTPIENNYGTIQYAVLAIFEQHDDSVSVVDFADLGEGGSYGIRESHTEADSMMLAENRFAIVVHNKSSEEGAGDSGYRKDDAELYFLINNKLTKIFECTIDDFYFVSNESDSYYERTSTTTIAPQPEKSKGLFNLKVTTVTDQRAITEESDDSEDKEDKLKNEDGLFKWNGKSYEKD